MATAAPAFTAHTPSHLPVRMSRWLWLATTALSTACFVILVSNPAQAQDCNGGPSIKTVSPYFFEGQRGIEAKDGATI